MQNLKPLASLCSWAGQFESYLVRNPEDRFSHDEAYFLTDICWHDCKWCNWYVDGQMEKVLV